MSFFQRIRLFLFSKDMKHLRIVIRGNREGDPWDQKETF